MGNLYCDICGRNQVRAQIFVEGAKLLACGSCMKSGKILQRFDDEIAEKGELVINSTPNLIEEEIVENFGSIIKKARDKASLPLSVIAERIREKESYLDAIENERLSPSLATAKKLEKELGIKLIEKSSDPLPASVVTNKKFEDLTLGDMIERKKGK